MRVLVLGSGGREHAIAWKLGASLAQDSVYLHPGNAGTVHSGIATLGDIAVTDFSLLAKTAREKGIGLIVIGPETLLALGAADHFRAQGFLVVGPGKLGAQLETSKVFAKEIMARAEIPTAKYSIVKTAEALCLVNALPKVLKLDGLAAGKGVVIAHTKADLETFSDRVWKHNEFGKGPHQVVVEDLLQGNEVSYLGFCDGRRFLPLPTATDYKRVGEQDTGGNTGGMGALSPSPFFNEALKEKTEKTILSPLLRQLEREGIEYRGILYVGLMVSKKGDPYVLEFNARFGDPETQSCLLRSESGFLELLLATARGTLEKNVEARWSSEPSLYVVGAAEGYPEKPKLGDVIDGIETVPKEVSIFYGGVGKNGLKFVTSGGRVLGLGAIGKDARENVYGAFQKIKWRGMHLRRDIGASK